MSWGHLSISAISQLLLARFGPTFQQRVQGAYTTDYNCHHDICPGDICPYHQYLSCYCPNLDQTLKKGPGNKYNRLQLSQRHLPMQHLSWGRLSISAISQLLLARFGLNFKQRVLGKYTTDYNCHHDICPGNICPGDICPYQQYLSCYWPDLDQT